MKPLKTFIIYSSKDKGLREELESHLRPLADLGWLELWSDKEILPGDRWDAAIKKQLQEADLFLMLVSVDFYNSGYIREEEFKTALERLENGAALVIPIIVRHCTWKFYSIIKDLQVLPPGGIAVNDQAHPVGEKNANELGLYDMSGNVWEWCEDCWQDNYTSAPVDGSAWVKGDSEKAVLRGGSWRNGNDTCRATFRSTSNQFNGVNYFGFRCARDL